ncbi:uncharacterized protein L969DRAFT_255376 [Mixia osmundae IAM 14324]|uniref:MIF4G domain-containing protein n=1 Tax=Mixia osmundae (strain CBS 9802 / IAM 14324 / JCM 22182 / KY 12970) TaxID=764103 RepID=G7DW45_MIXOS|nr:uncharacterized protein L969DRAFT_255376 [Mixia osmundae IAM 14324]KEI36451.1 hypothetical protein L969DRAFT_255376 [Mixia osmundae IAM 14324]GAA94851.1 hypothetical protein E5Q_01505 [Mixia osmundae IAM 14324]
MRVLSRDEAQVLPVSTVTTSAPLRRSANPWKRRAAGIASESPSERIRRQSCLLLNKLASQNFGSISTHIIDLSAECLAQVLDLVLDKACDEHQYSALFARLVRRLADRHPAITCPDEVLSIERICTRRLHESQNTLESMRKWKPIMFSDAYYSLQKARRHYFGLIIFIVELYKTELVDKSFLYDCAVRMRPAQQDLAEYRVEATCRFLTHLLALKLPIEDLLVPLQSHSSTILPVRLKCMIEDICDAATQP